MSGATDDVSEYIDRLEREVVRLRRDAAKEEHRANDTFLAATIAGGLLLSAAMAIVAPDKYGHGWVAVASFFIAAFACALPMAFATLVLQLAFARFRAS